MNREQFKAKILTRLGSNSIDVELTDSDLEEAIDDAVDEFTRKHFDGTELKSYKLPLVKGQKVYTLPPEIHAVVGYYATAFIQTPEIKTAIIQDFNLLYEGTEIYQYTVFKQYMEALGDTLIAKHNFRFNETINKITFEGLLDNVGDFIVLKCYTKISQTDVEKMYNNPWLLKFSTEKARWKWGWLMSKFDHELLDGAKLQGQLFMDTAEKNSDKLIEELKKELCGVACFLID